MDTSSPAAPVQIERFTFSGQGSEYFRIWIVNLLLSIVTLGIYSAWAKVRRLRYFYGNTQLAGSAFEYHGQPLQILKGRLIAFAFLAATVIVTSLWPLTNLLVIIALLFLTPWIVVKSRSFLLRMSSYRNIRLGFNQDHSGAAWAFVGVPMLMPLTLFLLFPYWTYVRARFAIVNSRFGTTPCGFLATARTYYWLYARASLILLPMLLVLLAVVRTRSAGLAQIEANTPQEARLAAFMLMLPVLIAVGLPFYLIYTAYMQKALGNASLGNALVGTHRLLSNLRTWPLLRLYVVNTVLIVVTLGLFIPWARVRVTRYRFECLALEVHGDLNAFVADQPVQVGATGEALGEFFDIDIGL